MSPDRARTESRNGRGPAPRAAAAILLLIALTAGAPVREKPMSLTLRSPSFKASGEIPRANTGDGKDLSPPLAWSGAPGGTRSFALVVHDPDAPDPAAPKMDWVHWVVYDIPAATSALPEGASGHALPKGTLEGLNDWKQPGWRGPAPPIGRHRYVFELRALDTVLPDLERPNRAKLEKAMDGHVLGKAELIGTYARH